MRGRCPAGQRGGFVIPDPLSPFTLIEPAPAKINLALAVTGRREDGYHLLDSLVTFTAFGDRIGLSPAEEDRFTLSGRFSETLAAEGDNLVTRARDRLRAALAESGQTAPPVSDAVPPDDEQARLLETLLTRMGVEVNLGDGRARIMFGSARRRSA